MIDSWGRLPGINHGFLEGNVVDLGVYDECIGISVDSDTIQVPVLPLPITTPAFKGQFMLIKIKPVIPDATSSEINRNIKEKLLSAGGGPILSQIIYEKMLVKDAVPDLPISEIIQQVGTFLQEELLNKFSCRNRRNKLLVVLCLLSLFTWCLRRILFAHAQGKRYACDRIDTESDLKKNNILFAIFEQRCFSK